MRSRSTTTQVYSLARLPQTLHPFVTRCLSKGSNSFFLLRLFYRSAIVFSLVIFSGDGSSFTKPSSPPTDSEYENCAKKGGNCFHVMRGSSPSVQFHAGSGRSATNLCELQTV